MVALTDSSGAVAERYRYDTYGQQTVLDPTSTTIRPASSYANLVGFTGYYQDNETGLYYARARMYSSSLGRFIGRDPIEYLGGMSLYGAYFVPNGVDPFGLKDPTVIEVDEDWAEWHIDSTPGAKPTKWPLRQHFTLTIDDEKCKVNINFKLEIDWPDGVTDDQKTAAKKMWSDGAAQWSGKYKACCKECPCPNGHEFSMTLEFVEKGGHHHITPKPGGRMDFLNWIYLEDPAWGATVPDRVGHELGHMMGNNERYGQMWEGSPSPDDPGGKWVPYDNYPGKMGFSSNPVTASDFEGLLNQLKNKTTMKDCVMKKVGEPCDK